MKQYFKAALTEINNLQVAIIWLDQKYLHKQDEVNKQLKFFQDLIQCPNMVGMIMDEHEKPVYYGKPEITEILKKMLWKKFPWQAFELER